MKLDVAQYGNYLGVFVTISNPSSDAAEDPTAATVKFYNVTSGVITHIAALDTSLVKQDNITGLWGTTVDVSLYQLSSMFIVVSALVGGVTRTSTLLLGSSTQKISVGAPTITVTRGPFSDSAEGPTV